MKPLSESVQVTHKVEGTGSTARTSKAEATRLWVDGAKAPTSQVQTPEMRCREIMKEAPPLAKRLAAFRRTGQEALLAGGVSTDSEVSNRNLRQGALTSHEQIIWKLNTEIICQENRRNDPRAK